jgi:hypothetical protein
MAGVDLNTARELLHKSLECSWIDTEAQVEPIRGEALHHEAAAKGVQREQGR